MLTSVAADEEHCDGKRSADGGYINPGATFRCASDTRGDIFRSLDPCRRQFKCPGDNERDWESDRDADDHQSHDPIWNLEEWKDLRRDLNYQPTDNRVRHGNLVDIPPLQLSEEVGGFHDLPPATFCTTASKRGSPRSESKNGSVLMN